MKRSGALWLTLVTIAGSIALISAQVGAHKISHDLLHPKLIRVLPLIAGQAVAYFGYAIAYKYMFGLDMKLAARRTFYGFSPLVTLGGFVYDRQWVARARRQTIMALAVTEYILLAPAVLFASVFALGTGQNIPHSLTIPWIAGVPAGAAITAATVLFRHRLHRRPAAAVNKILVEFKKLSIGGWLGILAGTAIYWMCELLVIYSALRLFGASLSIDTLVIAYATGYVLTRRSLPSSLAGFSIILMMIVLHWVGVPYAKAFLAIYSYLVINLALPLGYLTLIRRG